MILLASVLPAVNFDLGDWKLQLPVGRAGGDRGGHVEVVDLDAFSSEHFFTGADGAMVLRTPVDGATTRNSRYARTELREMDHGALAAWSLEEGGYLAVAMRVNEVPHRLDGGETRVVIGQIHGGDSQLVRLYYGAGSIVVVNGRNEDRERDLFLNVLDANGDQPHIDLDEPFSYSFKVADDDVLVTVQADGRTYERSIPVGPGWDDNRFYFKAGLYLSADESTATGWGQVSIYGLEVTHDGTTPSLPVPEPSAAPVAAEAKGSFTSLDDIKHVEVMEARVVPRHSLAEVSLGWASVIASAALGVFVVLGRRSHG